MNKIPAQIALLSALAVVTLSGCSVAGPPNYQPPRSDGQSRVVTPAPASDSLAEPATAAHPDKKPDTYLDSIRAGWFGDLTSMPDKQWLITAATLVCKQTLNGQEARAGITGDYSFKNERLVVTAAHAFVCEADNR